MKRKRSTSIKILDRPLLYWLKLYNPLDLAVIVALTFGLSFLLFWIITSDWTQTIIMSLVSTAFLVLYIYVQNKKLSYYRECLQGTLKYVNDLTFFLSTGENVIAALDLTESKLKGELKQDVAKVIERLNKDAELDLSHFAKYDFPALDQFHKNLDIYYQRGGDLKEIFEPIKKFMTKELSKRDDLYQQKLGFSAIYMVMIGGVIMIALILRFNVETLWNIFLSYKLQSFLGIFGLELMVIGCLYLLQRKKNDISVRL